MASIWKKLFKKKNKGGGKKKGGGNNSPTNKNNNRQISKGSLDRDEDVLTDLPPESAIADRLNRSKHSSGPSDIDGSFKSNLSSCGERSDEFLVPGGSSDMVFQEEEEAGGVETTYDCEGVVTTPALNWKKKESPTNVSASASSNNPPFKKKMTQQDSHSQRREKHRVCLKSSELNDLADEKQEVNPQKAAQFRTRQASNAGVTNENVLNSNSPTNAAGTGTAAIDPILTIRANLPKDPLLLTPFGSRRMTYADYTASGRSLHFVEEYIETVVIPLYANTHTETSASGLQTTHMREESRAIVLKALGASPKEYSLIFTGTGTTGAIWKLIAILGIHCPAQLMKHMDMTKVKRPLVLCSHVEHHSNELMWRETIADVIPIPPDETGSLDLKFLKDILETNKDKYELIIGSFSAGSNVTGLTTKPGPVASLIHKYGGYACFDYAGAGPYKTMKMSPNIEDDPDSYLDAIYISPHKFIGGPGTPGILCIRKDFANCRGSIDCPPTMAGGGTVTMVWPSDIDATANSNRLYESILHVREEAGTPGVIESIRCGLAFHVRELVGTKRIEELEGIYAAEAVRRLQAKKVWVMGDRYSNITSTERLSITSFNVFCKIQGITGQKLHESLSSSAFQSNFPEGTLVHPEFGRPLILHFHFVAALLNDLYGIQARSGCACAGPLSFRLFGDYYPFMTKKACDKIAVLAKDDMHALKPGFCRVNFNYFIENEEFDYILKALEQIAEHGWKLLPLYALCLKTGQYWYNGLNQSDDGHYQSFNRFDAVRTLTELQFQPDGSVAWNACLFSKDDRNTYLEEALKVYDNAPNLVRDMLFRFRDLRRRDMSFPKSLEEYRFFALGSEVLPYLGITNRDLLKQSESTLAKDLSTNPMITAAPQHKVANPFFTMDRPRG